MSARDNSKLRNDYSPEQSLMSLVTSDQDLRQETAIKAAEMIA